MDEDGFVRQRRNLLVISFVLLFAQGTGLTLTEVNIVGNKANLRTPLTLEPMLWIAWVYLFLRYWQAFNEYGQQKFKAAYQGQFQALITRYVVSRVDNISPSFAPHDEPNQPLQAPTVTEMKISGLNAEVKLRYTFQPPGKGTYMRERTWTVPRIAVFSQRLRALLHVTLVTSLTTELYLPFAVALAPVVFQLLAIKH